MDIAITSPYAIPYPDISQRNTHADHAPTNLAQATNNTAPEQTSKHAEPGTQNGAQSQSDAAVVRELKRRDTEVRQHEQAHLSAAGGLARSGASFTTQQGPDGKSYAIGGEVQIDVSPGSTPEETLIKARRIQAAALAPADPSGPDRSIAAQAQAMEQQASAEIALRTREQQRVASKYQIPTSEDLPRSTLATQA